MDTITHALTGALVARLICARPPAHPVTPTVSLPPQGRMAAAWDARADAIKPWQAVVVGTVAGAFPDIDAVTQLAGDLAYLRHHRGITHSVLMAPLWAGLLAVLLAPLWAHTRRMAHGWKPLWPLALAALLVHIAGDWITQFGTMLLEPLSDARFGLGAMFIIDLSFSGILLAALLLSALLPARRWPAALGLVLASGWVGLAWAGKQEAQALGWQHAQQQGIAAQWVDTMPRPASPFNWTVTVFDGQRYHVAHLNTRRTQPLRAGPGDSFIRRFSAPYLPADQAPWQTHWQMGDPATTPDWVAQAWAHEAFATFRWFAQSPLLMRVQQQAGPDGRPERCALFRDLRFDFPGREESPFQYGLCLDPQDRGRVVRVQGGVIQAV